jgi:uncharacterized protein YndB with AHSA1/START domain
MDQAENVTATIRIAATPAEVFPYLVEPFLLVQWIGTWADLNPEPGGVFAIDLDDALVRGTYVSVEPPDRVVFTWGIPGDDTLPPGSSTVEILLTADGDDTVVELTHRDLPSAWRPPHEAGWASYLDRLRQTATSDRARSPR